MRQAFLFDMITGRVGAPLDIPSFSWDITVADSSLSTTKDKGFGQDSASGMTVPWTAVPGSTWEQKRRALMPLRTGLMVFDRTQRDVDEQKPGRPIVGGAIGLRKDSAWDTSFDLISPLGLLEHRYMVREGVYGTGANHTSTDVITLRNLSLRAIACEIGVQCTSRKPGGSLPIRWPYLGEKGAHERTYESWDIQNLSAAHLLDLLTNVDGGPDMQFRPTLSADGLYTGWDFIAAADADIYLGQAQVHELSYAPSGGTMEDLTVARLGPIQRVYASGSGTDKAQITTMVEALSLVEQTDPYPLWESTYSDSDTDKSDLLRAHARGVLDANRQPLMQISARVNTADCGGGTTPVHPLGSFWPGERFLLDIQGYPPLPDGRYETRLMQMTGDKSDTVNLVFDVMEDAGT